MSQVQLPHKIVHEELALQWEVSSGSARELAMANSWYESVYILHICVLSVILVLLQSSVQWNVILTIAGITKYSVKQIFFMDPTNLLHIFM
jgi:hypothetical protein